jgi:hypothetical protein
MSTWRPGAGRGGAIRIRSAPMQAYRSAVQGMQLAGGQAFGIVNGAGVAVAQVGPQGLGNVWYPAMANITTTTGPGDVSTCTVYLGSQSLANMAGPTSYAGGGDSIGLSVPALTPGALLIAVWSGAHPGDTATLNIIGTMDCLA